MSGPRPRAARVPTRKEADPWTSSAAPAGALERVGFWFRRALEPVVKEACAAGFAGLAALSHEAPSERARVVRAGAPLRIGVVCEELFAAELGGYGGYGRTVRHLLEHDSAVDGVSFAALMPRDLGLVDAPEVRTLHGAETLLLPSFSSLLRHACRARRLVRDLDLDLLLTIDYQVQYEYVLWLAPSLPLIVYLRDPRAEAEWRQLASVPYAKAENLRPDARGLIDIARQQRASFRRVTRWGQPRGRRVVFAANGRFLVDRGRRKLGMPDLEAHLLPNPLPLPPAGAIAFPERPTLLWVGRLTPQKRPWLAVALARRHPGVRFVLAGPPGPRAVMEPFLAEVAGAPNVELVGVVEGAEKEALFRSCWALLNTSVHEGLPVTFLEAFGYGKCVISGVDPDGLATRFGYCTGRTDGVGLDEATQRAFSEQIDRCLTDERDRRTKGEAARRYVEENHTFETFGRHLRAIIEAEGLLAALS